MKIINARDHRAERTGTRHTQPPPTTAAGALNQTSQEEDKIQQTRTRFAQATAEPSLFHFRT